MVEPAGQSFEIADPVVVSIHEGGDIEAVDNRILVPEVEHGLLPRIRRYAIAHQAENRGNRTVPDLVFGGARSPSGFSAHAGC